MSSAPDMKRDALEGAIGPMDDLERILRERIAAARAFLAKSEDLLRTIAGDVEEAQDPNRYRGLLPEAATIAFFNSKCGRSMEKEELVNELIAGNVKTGSSKMEGEARKGNVRRSIEAQVNTGKIKRVNDRLGHPDWPDERFIP